MHNAQRTSHDGKSCRRDGPAAQGRGPAGGWIRAHPPPTSSGRQRQHARDALGVSSVRLFVVSFRFTMVSLADARTRYTGQVGEPGESVFAVRRRRWNERIAFTYAAALAPRFRGAMGRSTGRGVAALREGRVDVNLAGWLGLHVIGCPHLHPTIPGPGQAHAVMLQTNCPVGGRGTWAAVLPR